MPLGGRATDFQPQSGSTTIDRDGAHNHDGGRMPSRIGLAVIGAGRMGSNHARLIAAGAPELRIVAIGDVDGAAAGRLADEIGGAASFADPLDAIGAPGVDAVLIAVSSVHHRAIVEAAAAAGCDILCE